MRRDSLCGIPALLVGLGRKAEDDLKVLENTEEAMDNRKRREAKLKRIAELGVETVQMKSQKEWVLPRFILMR